MKKSFAGAIASAGAVIGAGFASGREICVFFTQYGKHSWLILLIACASFAVLCLQTAHAACGAKNWYQLLEERSAWQKNAARLCSALLMTVTAGAMISAGGHMISLLWANDWAYPVGAAGTLLAAWSLGHASLRPLSLLSTVLTLALIAAMLAAFCMIPSDQSIRLLPGQPAGAIVWGAVKAAAYAAMNLTLAIGVVCRCSEANRTENRRYALILASVLGGLMGLANALYLRHPQLLQENFPLVRLLAAFGRTGFMISVLLMYLSILTTLTAVLYALGEFAPRTEMRLLSCFVIPMAVSCLGFAGIVERVYAPSGLVCVALIFLPLFKRRTELDILP